MSDGPAKRSILTFDIGGTNIRAAIYDNDGDRLYARRDRRSPDATASGLGAEALWRELTGRMAALSDDILNGHRPRAVAVAFPAPLDAAGNAIASPTLFGDQGYLFPVRPAIESMWPGIPVVVLNDLSAAGYRYVDRWQDFCIVTVGSGIGHKVFLDGHPRIGARGHGGECGHLVVDDSPDAPVCDCGERGHLGAMASGRGTLRLARWRATRDLQRFRASSVGAACDGCPDSLDTARLVQAFRAGDPWTGEVVREAAGLLGHALAGIHLAVGLEVFIVVGGFAMALGEEYRRLVAAGARRACWNIGQSWEEMVRFGEPDDDHGLIGAGRHVAALVNRSPALAGSGLAA